MSMRQHIAIFTTASLPWLTGTAVNPLFRAAYLAKSGERDVTLVIPWLSLKDQELVYPNKITFDSPSEQESYVYRWLEERIDFRPKFGIKFYPGKQFSKEMRSILPVGDLTKCIPDEEADIAVLEEPEHLNWYHHGRKWKNKFRRVIGIVHTNYLEYVRREKNGQLLAFFLKYANTWVTRIYCHKIIRLSAATQELPRSIVCNVHGVNPKFLKIGKEKLEQLQRGEVAFTKGAYYIGKMVWSKGYRELLNLLSKNQSKLTGLQVDLYGSGEDSDEVQREAEKLSLAVKVHPGRDHADPLFHDYKVFLNPSTTDVVCTTTAEALAMGKIVICANHPSNDFFKQFPNCHIYNNEDEFVKLTLDALSGQPEPLTDEQRHELSWEAATERFIDAAELNHANVSTQKSLPPKMAFLPASLRMSKLKKSVEDASAYLHQSVSGIEVVRRAFGAAPKSLKPDEQLRKELGIDIPPRKKRSITSVLPKRLLSKKNKTS
ncbi:digalactosyldiacylglycerol synthase 2, chloroplastic-like isoform X1 [Ananas comosus]|uniref:Digalactosyldiacylglycerol synthase 2, chloroplastic n=1 Tax=Ananas comosus TaxID=4615 RepID=A0A6P5G698_ANACO|nr:digalactosyldiacylglycerol synthase 2, chloroplastic-like isoform X1 [Ananas comosus]XP_020100786.1 digalactosyldiacylglycerol synthase 2, chloroplastic-like isoform X1 [Ananas comosus]